MKMVLVLFAVFGIFLGYRLGTAFRGYVTLAAVSTAASLAQIGHLIVTAERSAMTLLPLVAGTVVVLSMLLGALMRRAAHVESTRGNWR
jgi:hypothetical protein